jgi:hypothetical protein
MKVILTLLVVVCTVGLPGGFLFHLYYSAHHRVFEVAGDIIDEKGSPLDTDVAVTETQFESVTGDSERLTFVPAPNGRFTIKTKPCNFVMLQFRFLGCDMQKIVFHVDSRVPKWLHVIMHKTAPEPATRPIATNIVGQYEIIPDPHNSCPLYQMMLDLKVDGSATALTTFTNNQSVVAVGTWVPHIEGRNTWIILKLEHQDIDPEIITGHPIRLDPTEDGRLLRHGGEAPMQRVGTDKWK